MKLPLLQCPAPQSANQRLMCSRSLQLLERQPDPVLLAVTQALAAHLDCPISLVSLLALGGQSFDVRLDSQQPEGGQHVPFCNHAILAESGARASQAANSATALNPNPFVVPDAALDPRFVSNPLVSGEAKIRFYAGQVLHLDGQIVGTLCVMDRQPRSLNSIDLALLQRMANVAEAALRVAQGFRETSLAELRLADFAQASSDFLWECDAALQLLWVSPSANDEVALKAQKSVGQPLWNNVLLDPTGHEHPRSRTLHEALADGQAFARRSIEVELGEHPASDLRMVSFSGVPVIGAGGALVGWRGSARDITVTAQAQRNVRMLNERLQHIASHVPGMLFQFETQPGGKLRFPYVSQGVEALYELSAADVQDDAALLVKRTHPVDLQVVEAHLAESVRAITPWRDEFRVVLPRGGVRWLQGHASPQSQDSGAVLWHGFLADVTETRNRAQLLEQSRQQLMLALAVTGTGVVQINTIAATIELDALATRAHHGEAVPGELSLWRWLQWMAPADRDNVQDAMSTVLAKGQPQRVAYSVQTLAPRRVELVLSRPDSTDLLLGVCRDVSQQERAEAALRQVAVASQQRQDELQFLARLSHELRTPLNALLGFSNLLADDTKAPLASHQQHWVTLLKRGGEHLLALIEDLLSLSSVGQGKPHLRLQALPLLDVLKPAMALLEPLAIASQISFHVAALPPDATVMADRKALDQVLINVLSNAIKYNRTGGSVRIQLLVSTATYTLEVCDEGPGMTPAQLARLFMPFERLGAEFGKVQGTGLGLAISRSLVEAMGGSISAHCPELGGGTCLRISLPSTFAD